VRGAANRFLVLYDQVKRVSPLLQFGLEKVEHLPWKQAEPVIDVLDNRIGNITQCVTGTVVAVQHKYQTSKAAVSEGATKTSEKWKDLRGDLTKKAAQRIEQGLGQAREFSATRGKEIFHVDLIQYSQVVIDGASDAVTRKLKPVYDPVARNLVASVQKVNQAATQLRQSVVDASKRAHLRLRLKEARQAARDLSSSSIAYVQAKYGDVSARISDSSTLNKCLQFIASSPQLFQKIKTRADLDASKSILENLNNLMLAIRDVVLQQGEEIVTEDVAGTVVETSEEKIHIDVPAIPSKEEEISAEEGDFADQSPTEDAVASEDSQPEAEIRDESD